MDVAGMIAMWVVTAIVAGCGAYFGAYLKKHGEQRALKENYDEILGQLKKSTRAAKELETKILHRDWTERELKTLRRAKIEEILRGLYATTEFVAAERSSLWYEGKSVPLVDPMDEAGMYTSLYFFDLYPLYSAMSVSVAACRKVAGDAYLEMLRRGNDIGARLAVFDDCQAEWLRTYQGILSARIPFETALRDIMRANTEVIAAPLAGG